MSIVKDTFFGGAEKKAGKRQERALEQSQELVKEGVEQAKTDVNRLFPQAQEMSRQGFGGAFDIFNQATPEQMSLYQQGNVGAQNALLSGLPQMNQAILGGPIDYSQLQAQQFQAPEFNFQAPQFLQAPEQAPQPQPQAFTQDQYNTPSPFSQFSSQYAQNVNPFTGGSFSSGGGGSGGSNARGFNMPRMQMR